MTASLLLLLLLLAPLLPAPRETLL